MDDGKPLAGGERTGVGLAGWDPDPASDAPSTAPSDAISSSIWTNTPPRLGSAAAICSAISDEGVMG